MKQTAVEWLYDQIENKGKSIYEILEQAKAMEQKQIIEAYETAEKNCGRDFLHGDLYYNETFKSE